MILLAPFLFVVKVSLWCFASTRFSWLGEERECKATHPAHDKGYR